MVIDPKPYVGDPAYDLLQHMLTCKGRLAADPARRPDGGGPGPGGGAIKGRRRASLLDVKCREQ